MSTIQGAKSQKSIQGRSMKSSMIAPPSQSLSSRIGSSTLAKLSEKTKVLLLNESEKVTLLAPVVVEQMVRAKMMYERSAKLMEKIKCTAQPNKAFRSERLVASNVGAMDEKDELSRTVRSAEACYDNIQPLADYVRELADVHHEIACARDIFLRQIMKFSVKPLKEYVVCVYPQLTHAYETLIKMRDRFDAARAKNVQVDLRLEQLQQQATAFESYLDNLPAHQMAMAKSVDLFLRAEAHYFRQINDAFRKLKSPECKSRW